MSKNFIWIVLPAALIGVAAVAGFFIYLQGIKKEQKQQEAIVVVSPTPILTQEASPIPAPPKVDISKYKIEVLNGSGISGEAARVKTLFEQEGFTVISIGNSDRSNYKETIVQVKKDTPEAFLNKLKSLLEETYVVSIVIALSPDENVDTIVIVGRSQKEE